MNLFQGKMKFYQIHRFLAGQSLYPILLSSLLAVFLLVARGLVGHTWSYNSMLWNLFLAWVPYIFSTVSLSLYLTWPKQWWLLLAPAGLWLIFFPNAPYIVTDFLHLHWRPPVPLWYDIGLLATFSWTGCFLGIVSLRAMQFIVKQYLGPLASWLFVAVSLLLSGLGVYLGRFARWNSWDVFTQPDEVFKDIVIRVINPLNNLRFVVFTLMFTAFLFVSYLMFTSMDNLEKSVNSDQ